MIEIIQALDSHVEQEGAEVEVRLSEGGWDDIRTLVGPFAEAWARIGALCNEHALDEDDAKEQIEYIQGISAMAHKILRQMAAAEQAVQGRNS